MSEENENAEDAMAAAMDEAIAEVSPEKVDDDDDSRHDDAGDDAGDTESDDPGDTDEANDDVGDDDEAVDDGEADEDAAADDEAGETDDSDDKSDTGDSDDGDEKSAAHGETDDGDKSEDTADDGDAPDHVNDPIPESTNEKTAARITGLIDIAKEQTHRANQGDEVIAAITNTGADPEQYSNTLGFLSLYNSKDPTQRKQALEVARGVVHELSIELGDSGSLNLLGKHDDLKAEVESGDLTETRAVEIATQREQTALTTLRTNKTNADAKATQDTNNLVALGKDQLTAFEATVRTDPAYDALYPTFRGILSSTLRSVHPDQWGATARSVYENLKANYTPAAIVPKPKPGKTPLRAKQGAGGGAAKSTEATSASEAMDAALADM